MRKLIGLRLPLLLLPFFFLSSCDQRRPTAPLDANPWFAIEDAVHGGGNEHFYWLPPMITPAPTYAGTFDASADPTIDVCEWSGTGCSGDPLLTITTASGLTVNTVDKWYGVDWYVFDHDPAEGDVYRVSVSASGQPLGFADLMIVDKVTGQVKKTLGDDYILLSESNGRKFLKIRFRIEEGAITASSGTLYAKVGGSVGVFDISDLNDIQLIHLEAYTLAGSKNLAFDRAGNLYTGWGDFLNVYDAHLDLIGHFDVPNPPEPVGPLFLATRPGRAFGCHPNYYPSLLFVFNTEDVTSPYLAGIIDVPGTGPSTPECRGMEFDAAGNLWVSGFGQLIKLTLDAAGVPQTSEIFPLTGHPIDVAFDPISGRLFYAWVNQNAVQVLDPSDPSQVLANITGLCNVVTDSPGSLTFDASGNLFVSCEYPPDIVVLPHNSLLGISGVVDASTLGMIEVDVPEMANSAKWLAVSPLTVSFP